MSPQILTRSDQVLTRADQALARTENAAQQRTVPIVLPLFMPSGKPYYYTETERIVQTLAMLPTGAVSSASAIAQEAYYSCLLDGAVGFSSQAQQALLFALQRLQAPIDTAFVDALVRLLTGAEVGIRTADIPGTPPPATISWHMDQIYRFLVDERFHPLIKSAACHAFVLAVQPYALQPYALQPYDTLHPAVQPSSPVNNNNANGRLARLLSMLFMIHSGYSFLINSSYSAVIAKYSAEYAQAFQSIFSANSSYGQAGNLTGFIEFIVGILMETLEMARRYSPATPVAASATDAANVGSTKVMQASHSTVAASAADAGSETTTEPVSAPMPATTTIPTVSEPDIPSHKGRTNCRSLNSAVPGQPVQDAISFTDTLSILDHSKSPLVKRTAFIVREMMRKGCCEFTRSSWIEQTGMAFKEFDACRDTLKRYKLIRPVKRSGNGSSPIVYRFTVKDDLGDRESATDVEDEQTEYHSDEEEQRSASAAEERRSASDVDEQRRASVADAQHPTSAERSASAVEEQRRASVADAQPASSAIEDQQSASITGDQQPTSAEESENECEPADDQPDSPFFIHLADMENSRHEHLRKTAAIVRSFLDDGILAFSNLDWMYKNSVSYHEFDKSRKCLAKREMIIKDTAEKRYTRRYLFTVPNNPEILNNPILRDKVFSNHTVLPAAQFWAQVDSLEQSRSALTRSLATIVREMIAEGITEYTTNQWVSRTGMNQNDYAACRNRLCTKHIVYGVRRYKTDPEGNSRRVRSTLFRFTLEGLEFSQNPIQNSGYASYTELSVDEFVSQLESMELSRSLVVRQSAELIRKKISARSMTFTQKEWVQTLELSKNQFITCIQSMRSRRVVSCCSRNTYRFNVPEDTVLPENNPMNCIHLEDYQPALQLLKALSKIDRIDEKIVAILINPYKRFRIEDWQRANGLSREEAEHDLNSMIQMGLVSFRSRPSTYKFRFRSPDELIRKIHIGTVHEPYVSEADTDDINHEPNRFDFWPELVNIDNSPSSLIRSVAPAIKSFLDQGIQYFSTEMLVKESGINHHQCRLIVRALKRNHVIEEYSYFNASSKIKRHQGFYRILYGDGKNKTETADLIGLSGSIPTETIKRIKELQNGKSYEKRLGDFLIQLLSHSQRCFTLNDYAQHYDLSLACLSQDLYHGLDIGVLDHKTALCHSVYYIPTEPIPKIRVKGLTNEMKMMLTSIYHEYGQNDFLSTGILCKFTELKWLHRLIARGIMYRERRGVQYYSRLLISPQTNPECFVLSSGTVNRQ